MGQTQLLMLVMAVIIIGIAVAVGISQMTESAYTANQNAIVNDCASLISKAQTWYRTPTMMGGGANSFSGISLLAIGAGPADGVKENENGQFALGGNLQQVECVGVGNEENEEGFVPWVTILYDAAQTGDAAWTTTIESKAEAVPSSSLGGAAQ